MVIDKNKVVPIDSSGNFDRQSELRVARQNAVEAGVNPEVVIMPNRGEEEAVKQSDEELIKAAQKLDPGASVEQITEKLAETKAAGLDPKEALAFFLQYMQGDRKIEAGDARNVADAALDASWEKNKAA